MYDEGPPPSLPTGLTVGTPTLLHHEAPLSHSIQQFQALLQQIQLNFRDGVAHHPLLLIYSLVVMKNRSTFLNRCGFELVCCHVYLHYNKVVDAVAITPRCWIVQQSLYHNSLESMCSCLRVQTMPLSAPGHLQLVPRLVLPNQSTHTQTDTPPSSSKTSKSCSPRPEKPTPPPKPASIRRAVSNLARRPTRIPSKTRGWSGAKTTPTTPVTTPTHSAKPRLPSARTPRSSGRSTPNTTPTTPTHCEYIFSFFV
ncbi:hypothetical protein SK128_007495 [Halocaridina rubra]|uniref:Uncharacterized protein n=1 Tax=Halocaridina rubra TaxID=373956 RepID=A0AAN8WV02_HALRR